MAMELSDVESSANEVKIGMLCPNESRMQSVNKQDRPKSWRTRRTGLEKFLILAVMVLVLLLLIMIFVAAIFLQNKSSGGANHSAADECLSSTSAQAGRANHSASDECLCPTCVQAGRANHSTTDVRLSPTIVQAASRIIAALDITTPPCEDFYQYSCGTWNQQHPVPEDKPERGVRSEMDDDRLTILRNLLEDDGKDLGLTSIMNAKKLYKSCIDTDRINTLDSAPLLSLLSDLGGWPVLNPDWDESGFDYIDLMAKLRLYGIFVFLYQWVWPDDRDSSRYIIHLYPADRFVKLNLVTGIPASEKYARKIATMLGAAPEVARNDMREVVNFEIALINACHNRSLRDYRSSMNINTNYSISTQYTNVTSSINWHRYLDLVFRNVSMSIDKSEEVDWSAQEYAKPMFDLVERTNPRVLANYMIWKLVQRTVDSLSERFHDHSPARWRTCVSLVDSNFRDVLGRMYIEENFKRKTLEDSAMLIDNLRAAFKSLIQEIPWMDKWTKSVGTDKADAMRIGYPELILNNTHLDLQYSQLVMAEEDYFHNMLLIRNTKVRNDMKLLRKPVKKKSWEWYMISTRATAYYSRYLNQLTGILQPPLYHPEFPKSLQYGGFGVMIGHEITHGFDEGGRRFDKDGDFSDWWSEDVLYEFKKKAQCFIDQYGNYTLPEGDININGTSTQGENLADNRGLKIAYKAYKDWVSRQDHQEPLLPGLDLTHDQLFFVNFAQIWCGREREESLTSGLKTAPHSPGRYRVIGSVSNSPDFAKAFNCSVGSPMNPTLKCDLW